MPDPYPRRPAARPVRRPDRRGAVLPFILFTLTVLIGAAALAIDLGRLRTTATEVQGVADAAALGAVAASQFYPDSDSRIAPPRAQAIAARNRAAGQPGSVATADIVPAWYSQGAGTTTPTTYFGQVNASVVTARVRQTYVLAQALRLSPPTVARSATAWIGNMQGAACVRPIAIPYTRIYEDAAFMTSHPYSTANPMQYAPTITQAQVAQYSQYPPVYRTFSVVPPWRDGTAVDNGGHPVSGSWHTADYTGGNVDRAAYERYISAPNSGPTCAAAVTSVGSYLNPFVWHPVDADTGGAPYGAYPNGFLDRNRSAFLALCNQYGGGDTTTHVATCRNSDGSVGVSTRVAFTDSIPKPGGHFTQRVRMVSQLRIMCYFVYATDRCPAQSISNGAGGTYYWSMPWTCRNNGNCGQPNSYQTVDRGYPRGTMVVLLDGPVYGDITPDVTLGDSLSLTQRLVLVK